MLAELLAAFLFPLEPSALLLLPDAEKGLLDDEKRRSVLIAADDDVDGA